MRDAIRQWLMTMSFTHFGTFNFNCSTTLESARKKLRHFHACWDNEIFGKRYNRATPEKRLFMCVFPEHINTNTHFHALIRSSIKTTGNTPDFRLEAPKLWENIIASGSLYIPEVPAEKLALMSDESVISGEQLQRIANYITKDTIKQKNYDSFILSNEFLPL